VGAFSVKDGTPRWWLKAPAELTAPPVVFGSWVVLGFRDGSLYKVEVLTGKIVWKASLDSFASRSFTLSGSTLLVVTAGQYLHSIDYQSGESQWLFDGGFPAGLAVRSKTAPLVYNNTVYYGISSGELLAVDLASGKLNWRYNPEYSDARFKDVVGEMVIINNRLIFSRNDGLVGAVALGTKQQRLVWSHRFPSVAASVFRGGRYFVGLVNGDMIAMQVSDGNRLWRTITGKGISTIKAGERVLYVAGMKGRISAIESANGNIKWTDDLGGLVAAESFYIGSKIYFATGAHNIYGYKL
jgi:outer membrane protein assembly factor BamB